MNIVIFYNGISRPAPRFFKQIRTSFIGNCAFLCLCGESQNTVLYFSIDSRLFLCYTDVQLRKPNSFEERNTQKHQEG
jgi:hypothetical protein